MHFMDFVLSSNHIFAYVNEDLTHFTVFAIADIEEYLDNAENIDEEPTNFEEWIALMRSSERGDQWFIELSEKRRRAMGYNSSDSGRGSEQSTANTKTNSRSSGKTSRNNARQFSLDISPEETKDLVALHNLRENNLTETLNLGGFAMPSIAVVKKDMGHSNFGNISVVFGKETIDPQIDRDNKVYGGDAYTPTFPKIDVDVNEKKAYKLYDKMIDLEKKKSAIPFNSVSFHPDNLRNKLKNGGAQAIIDSYKNNYAMKNAYLAETDNQLQEMPQS